MKNSEGEKKIKTRVQRPYSLFLSDTHTADVIVLPSECVYISIHSFIHGVLVFVFRSVTVFLSTFFPLFISFFRGVRFFSFNPIVSVHLCVHFTLANRLPIYNSHFVRMQKKNPENSNFTNEKMTQQSHHICVLRHPNKTRW